MSNPSFSNIDQWLFELSEGNLSPEQIARLELFIIQHPELEVDLDMWKLSYVDATPLIYPNQKSLEKKRPVIWYWTSSAAALFILLISGAMYFSGIGSFSTQVLNSVANTNFEISINDDHLNNDTSFRALQLDKDLIINSGEKVAINNFNSSGSKLASSPTLNADKINQLSLRDNDNSLKSFNGKQDDTQTDYQVSETQLSTNNYSSPFTGDLSLKRFAFNNEYNGSLAKAMSKEEEIEEWKLNRTSAKHKSQTFSSKLHDFKRAIQKMADNPIALKNLKDPHYHVPGMQAPDVNFGAVGTLLATRVQTNSRYQWMGQSNDQLMNSLLIDGYAYAIRGGIGLQINQSTYHNNGYQNTFAAITYSPKFSINKNVTIEPAFRFKMGNQRINASKLPIGQMVEFDRSNAQQFYSETETPIGKAQWYKDFGLSVMANTKWFYAGIQFDNLAKHQNNVYGESGTQRAGIHSVITIGTDYESQNKKFGLSPYLVYQNYQNLSEAWLGANVRASWLTVGGAISSNLEPAASAGVKFKHFALTYNIDYTKSMITNNYALSHQLTLRFLTNPSRVGQRLLNY